MAHTIIKVLAAALIAGTFTGLTKDWGLSHERVRFEPRHCLVWPEVENGREYCRLAVG